MKKKSRIPKSKTRDLIARAEKICTVGNCPFEGTHYVWFDGNVHRLCGNHYRFWEEIHLEKFFATDYMLPLGENKND